MKMRKFLCLLLALAMMACVFAGCSKTEEPAAEVPAAEPAEAPAEEAPAPAAASSSTTEAIAQAAEAMTEGMTSAEMAEVAASADTASVAQAVAAVKAGDYTSAGGIHYPLSDGSDTITFWNPFGFGWESFMDSWNDMYIMPYLQEATGIQLEFDCVSQSAATEQFQLYIAGGDYSDIMQPGDYYTGGLGQAYADEVILDLTADMPNYSPDYWAHLNALDEDTIDGVKTDSMMLGYVVIYNANWADQGLICVSNMAEECGYEVVDNVLQVDTMDTFTQLLRDVYDTFGCQWTIALDSDDGGSANLGSNAFQGAIASISSESTSVGVELQGDTVVAAATTDTFRNYARWFNEMYNYGIINEDFYMTTLDNSAMMGYIGAGNVFTWTSRADGTDSFKDYLDADHADLDSAIIGTLYAEEGQANEYPTSVSLVDNKQYVVTTSCEQVELVMNYLNFGYTEGGYELYNWGVEGESFYIDEEGAYHYTDLIWNNPDGANFMMASAQHIMGQLPRYDEHAKLNDGYTEKQITAQNCWTNTDGEDLHTIPTKANLTTDESNSIINDVNDVIATLSEWGLKFYTGALDVDDDAVWGQFQDALVSAGIETVVATYQGAYDSYLRGERDNIVVATPAGAGGPPPDMPPM